MIFNQMFSKIVAAIRFFKYNTHPARIEAKTRKVVLFGLNKAFEIFKNKKFRSFLQFENKQIKEQDRIFNELTVTNIVFLMFLLEQIIHDTEEEDRQEYFRAIKENIPKYFAGFIGRLGIENGYINLWDYLINMRHEEYTASINDFRAEFLKQKDRKISELAYDNLIMIFQAIAFGLYKHIMRGKIKRGDPFYDFLQSYLLRVHKGYLKRI